MLPPSLRFFGRRVYLWPVFVLVWAMLHGLSDRRAAALCELVAVSKHTLSRWHTWWQEVFTHSGFWRTARARRMRDDRDLSRAERWARFGFSVIGPLLSAPPEGRGNCA